MARIILVISLIGGLLCGQAVIWAGEKEELELKRQVILERMEKLKAQSQVLAIQFETSKIELANIEAMLKPLLEKEKKVDTPPAPGKK